MKYDNWYLFFMFFMLTEDKDDLIQLLSSDSFDSDFNFIINKIKKADAEKLVNKSVNEILDKKQILKDINKAYKEIAGTAPRDDFSLA